MIEVGTVLADRYELQERLGVGGMGEVYRAYDRRFRLDVAIKALLPHVSRDEQLVERFLREGRTLALLRHPGIIGIFDMLHHEGSDFLVLEFVPGHSLEDELAGGRLPWSHCADIGAQVCEALAAAHARGVIHRDIKPSNILLEPSGLVRVADFGIARLASHGSLVTRAGVSIGTPGFWAPEQALGQVSSARSDLYSLGAVLFLAGTGRLPFVADEEGPATAYLNVTLPVPDPLDVAPDLPPAAARAIVRALAKDPAERFQTAAEMAGALRASAGLPNVPVAPYDTPVPEAEELSAAPTEEEAGLGAPETVLTPKPPGGLFDPGAPEAPETETSPETPETETSPETPETEVSPETPETEVSPETPETEVSPETPETEVSAAPKTQPRGDGGAVAGTVRPRTRVPRPDRLARRPPRSGLVAVAGVAAAAVAVVAGLFAGGAFSGDEPARPVTTDRVTGGVGSVAVPVAWPTSAGASLPGLTLAGATSAAPERGTGEQLLVGRADAEGPTLLPPELRQRRIGSSEGEPVLLGKIQAYRYQDVRIEGFSGRLTLFVVPTSRGVQVVACGAPEDRYASFLPVCESAATTLRLRGARAFPLGPSPTYAAAVRAAMTRLAGRRETLRAQLRSASTPDAQAGIAGRLADAFGAAASALSRQELGPEGAGLNEGLVAALRSQRSAYATLASAAREGNATAYAAARRGVRAAELRTTQATRTLEARGYRLTP